MHKNTQKQKKCYKNAKIFKGMNQQWRSKKPWQQNETNARGPQHGKGSLKVGPAPHKQDGDQTKRDTHHTIYVMGATPPPPSGREHPEGLPIPPYSWKTLWITPVTHITM